MYSIPLVRHSSNDTSDFYHAFDKFGGFCGRIFVEFFPEAAQWSSFRLNISKVPTTAKNEKHVIYRPGSCSTVSGILHDGGFTQLPESTCRYIATQMCLVDGENLYISVSLDEPLPIRNNGLVLKRKDHGAADCDFNFVNGHGAGFCGQIFIRKFPHTKNAKLVQLKISTRRQHRKGELQMKLVGGTKLRSKDGVTHQGEFIFILNDAVRHVINIVPLKDGQTFYVQAIVLS